MDPERSAKTREKQKILFVGLMPPSHEGIGSAQRAAHLYEALDLLGEVAVVQLTRSNGNDTPKKNLACRPQDFSVISVTGWRPSSEMRRWIPWRFGMWLDWLRYGSSDAVRLPRLAVRRLAAQLPAADFDIVFVTRLSATLIVDEMLNAGLIRCRKKIADFDDVMSEVRKRQLISEGPARGVGWRMLMRLQTAAIGKAEKRILHDWNAVGVCSDSDVARLKEIASNANIAKLPNVIDRPQLKALSNTTAKILFVGAFSYSPNLEGLTHFLNHAWPLVVQQQPDLKLVAVGMAPPETLTSLLEKMGIELFANVPSVVPYYTDCDIVICPILVGGGTRIKLIEAMAYGRAIVSTTIGAEGLGLIDGVHALIVDTMEDFAEAILRLANNPDLRRSLVANARELQQRLYSTNAMHTAVAHLIDCVTHSDGEVGSNPGHASL